MRWSVSFYLSSKRNRKTNIWFKLNQFVAGTSLKESAKKGLRVIKCKTNNSQQAEESKDCNFGIYRQCHRTQRYKFRQRLRWGRRRKATMTLSCNIQMNNKNPREKANIIFNTGGSFRHYNNCGSTHPSMAASKENKFPPSFSGFNSQKFLHESSYDGVSGEDYRTMMNSR